MRELSQLFLLAIATSLWTTDSSVRAEAKPNARHTERSAADNFQFSNPPAIFPASSVGLSAESAAGNAFWPKATIDFELEPDGSGLTYTNSSVSARFLAPPPVGPVPLSIIPGYSVATFDGTRSHDVPATLHLVSLGFEWLCPLHENWAVRLGVTPSFASDFENTSSDAWRMRATAMAFYTHRPGWKLVFGAVATGREDVPVLPAAGVIWSPNTRTKAELLFPRPRISYIVNDDGCRRNSIYIGGGFAGGTWAFDRRDGTDDILTYRVLRLAGGWESTPSNESPFGARDGLHWHIEAGWAFDRSLEFESSAPDFEPDDTAFLSVGASY